ncbi:hypothetical protein JTE90_024540 [Oedothorax gibbosus]|uniref:Uncharacterized protein n=1 Tax=Oedothorax gibbosus TaxID=931172 RepID=A0AAV6VEZ1_9ARAC|nr:hypothetical protein JTE90_024540 [Oedothorax gibbosus]
MPFLNQHKKSCTPQQLTTTTEPPKHTSRPHNNPIIRTVKTSTSHVTYTTRWCHSHVYLIKHHPFHKNKRDAGSPYFASFLLPSSNEETTLSRKPFSKSPLLRQLALIWCILYTRFQSSNFEESFFTATVPVRRIHSNQQLVHTA